MSDASQGPGWWFASDGKWYPPDQISASSPTLNPTMAPASQPGDPAGAPGPPAETPTGSHTGLIALVVGIAAILLVAGAVGAYVVLRGSSTSNDSAAGIARFCKDSATASDTLDGIDYSDPTQIRKILSVVHHLGGEAPSALEDDFKVIDAQLTKVSNGDKTIDENAVSAAGQDESDWESTNCP